MNRCSWNGLRVIQREKSSSNYTNNLLFFNYENQNHMISRRDCKTYQGPIWREYYSSGMFSRSCEGWRAEGNNWNSNNYWEGGNSKKKKTNAPKIKPDGIKTVSDKRIEIIKKKKEEEWKILTPPVRPPEYYEALKINTLARKIDIFRGSEEKWFTLVHSAESVTEASKYVKTSYPSNISKYVDSGKVYNNQWKFISRKK